MIINKEEVEKFIEKETFQVPYDGSNKFYNEDKAKGIKLGVEFAEEYVYKYTSDLVIENQGLKLYKDNEAERFKELAIEFAEFIIDYEKTPHLNRLETTEELYELFLKQRNEKN